MRLLNRSYVCRNLYKLEYAGAYRVSRETTRSLTQSSSVVQLGPQNFLSFWEESVQRLPDSSIFIFLHCLSGASFAHGRLLHSKNGTLHFGEKSRHDGFRAMMLGLLRGSFLSGQPRVHLIIWSVFAWPASKAAALHSGSTVQLAGRSTCRGVGVCRLE